MTDRVEYLENLIPTERREKLEVKYWDKFCKYSNYLGNGVYTWLGILCTDTRELFLIGIYTKEKIKFKKV